MPAVSTACPVLRKEKSVQKWEQDGTRACPQLVHCPAEAENSCRISVCTAIHHGQCQLRASSRERWHTQQKSNGGPTFFEHHCQAAHPLCSEKGLSLKFFKLYIYIYIYILNHISSPGVGRCKCCRTSH